MAVILAVDDDRGVLDALHLVLDDDHEVIDADSGDRALALLRSRPIDLLLLDLVIDGMDGITLLERIRGAAIDVPVLIVSALREASVAATAMRLGAVDYVTKPFDDHELLASVSSALARAGQAAALGVRERLPRLLLVGCPVGAAATLSVGLSAHARVESVPARGESLALVPAGSPDVIVADLDQIGEPGDALIKIRNRFPLAPIIVTNAVGPMRGERLGIEAEAVAVLTRPVSLRELLEEIRREMRPSVHPLPRFSERVVAVMECVGQHLPSVTMPELGRALETSPYYLSRLFGAETGMTLKTYLHRVRVQAARQLLLETREKTETVAALVGLHDASHLSRLFLKYAGRRPRDFRRTWWGDD